MNNIGAVLMALPGRECTQVVEELGFILPGSKQNDDTASTLTKAATGVNVDNSNPADVAIEGIFRRVLEVESSHRWGMVNLGLHLHSLGRNEDVSEKSLSEKSVRLSHPTRGNDDTWPSTDIDRLTKCMYRIQMK